VDFKQINIKKMNWILFIVIGIVAFILISRSMGNPTFWKLVNKNQIKAYDFFMSNDCWYVIHPNETKTKPTQGEWDGPFFVVIKGIGRIKIYGREGYKQKQKEFTNLINHNVIISQTVETNEGITPEQSLNGTKVVLPDGTIGEISHSVNGDGKIGVYRLDEDGEVISSSEKYLPTELKLYNEEDDEEDETITDGTQDINLSPQTTEISGQNQTEGINTGNGSINNVGNTDTNTQVIPVDAKGEIDYEAIQTSDIYAQALIQEFGEGANGILNDLVSKETKALKQANNNENPIEKARALKKANAKLAMYEQVNAIFNPIAPVQEATAPVENVSTPVAEDNTEDAPTNTEVAPLINDTKKSEKINIQNDNSPKSILN
jgi:hypothetical protein